MKRTWFGVCLLILLLAGGIFVTVGMHRICRPIWQQLEQAALSTDRSEALCAAARSRWERFHKLTASVTDHEPMEQIDALFEELELYARQNDRLRFARCCASLASQVRAIAESQSVNWWNIL